MEKICRSMDYPIIILTAIGLAMDCLAVSISCGITMHDFNHRDALIMAIFFGAFQGGMALLGWLGGTGFADQIESIDHWAAFGLLSIIGGKMIREGLEQKSESETFNIRRFRVLITLSIATSIDALAIGITYAFLQTPILIPVLFIGIMSFMFAIFGSMLGKKLGQYFGNRMEIIGGIILIGLGIKILIEHTILA